MACRSGAASAALPLRCCACCWRGPAAALYARESARVQQGHVLSSAQPATRCVEPGASRPPTASCTCTAPALFQKPPSAQVLGAADLTLGLLVLAGALNAAFLALLPADSRRPPISAAPSSMLLRLHAAACLQRTNWRPGMDKKGPGGWAGKSHASGAAFAAGADEGQRAGPAGRALPPPPIWYSRGSNGHLTDYTLSRVP